MLIIIIILAIAIWYIWQTKRDELLERDPVVVKLKQKLVSIFPELENVKLIKSDASFTINKSKIYLCTERDGTKYDDNMLTYVVLHELAHVMTPEIGHGKEFMKNFSFLLSKAAMEGVWDPTLPRVKNYCTS